MESPDLAFNFLEILFVKAWKHELIDSQPQLLLSDIKPSSFWSTPKALKEIHYQSTHCFTLTSGSIDSAVNYNGHYELANEERAGNLLCVG